MRVSQIKATCPKQYQTLFGFCQDFAYTVFSPRHLKILCKSYYLNFNFFWYRRYIFKNSWISSPFLFWFFFPINLKPGRFSSLQKLGQYYLYFWSVFLEFNLLYKSFILQYIQNGLKLVLFLTWTHTYSAFLPLFISWRRHHYYGLSYFTKERVSLLSINHGF